MNYSQLKQKAKINLESFWVTSIAVMVTYYIISSIPSILKSNSLFGFSIFSFGLTVLLYPLSVGYANYHLNMAAVRYPVFQDLFEGFKDYGRNLVTMLLSFIYIFLFTLLLIVPGIIKAFSFSMVPYILADNEYTGLSFNEVLAESESIMDGHKMELFLLGLSFILWILLCIVTFGAALLYVEPYMRATFTNFYLHIRTEHTSNSGRNGSSSNHPLDMVDAKSTWEY